MEEKESIINTYNKLYEAKSVYYQYFRTKNFIKIKDAADDIKEIINSKDYNELSSTLRSLVCIEFAKCSQFKYDDEIHDILSNMPEGHDATHRAAKKYWNAFFEYDKLKRGIELPFMGIIHTWKKVLRLSDDSASIMPSYLDHSATYLSSRCNYIIGKFLKDNKEKNPGDANHSDGSEYFAKSKELLIKAWRNSQFGDLEVTRNPNIATMFLKEHRKETFSSDESYVKFVKNINKAMDSYKKYYSYPEVEELRKVIGR